MRWYLFAVVWLQCAMLCGQISAESLFPVKIKDKWGYIDTAGKIHIEAIFDNAERFRNFDLAKVKKEGKVMLVTRSGNLIDLPERGEYFVLSNKLLKFFSDSAFGIVTLDNREVFPREFSRISSLENSSFFILEKGGFCGVGDENGNLVIPIRYKSVRWLDTGVFCVSNGTKSGICNGRGEEIISPVWDEIQLNHNFLMVKNEKKWGILDIQNDTLAEPRFNEIQSLSKNTFVLRGNDSVLCFFAETNRFFGNKVISAYTEFNSKVVRSSDGIHFGFVSRDGTEVLPCNFRSVSSAGTVYLITNDTAFGLIDADFKLITPFKYRYVDTFHKNLAVVSTMDQRWGVLHMNGTEVIKTVYDRIIMFSGSFKAYRGSEIVISTYDDDGRITGEEKFGNVKMVNVNVSSAIEDVATRTQQRRILNSRWFYDGSVRRWGLKNEADSVIIRPVFSRIILGQSPRYVMVEIEGSHIAPVASVSYSFGSRKGIVDQLSGSILLKPQYLHIDTCIINNENFCYARVIEDNGSFSLVDNSFRIFLKGAKFVDRPHRGISRIYTGQLGRATEDGYIRSAASELSNAGLQGCRTSIREGSQVFFVSEAWRYIDTSLRLSEYFLYAENFRFNNAIVLGKGPDNGAYYGVFNQDFSYSVEKEYDTIFREFSGTTHCYLLKSNRKVFAMIGENAELITPFRFTRIFPFVNGHAIVRLASGKHSYINNEGKLIDSFGFDRAFNFTTDGIARVKINGGWTFINESGKKITDRFYANANDFSNGYGFVKKRKSKEWTRISSDGAEMTGGVNVEAMLAMRDELIKVKKNGLVGYVDLAGRIKIRFKYRRTISTDTSTFYFLSKGAGFGVINKEGKKIIPFRYRKLTVLSNGNIMGVSGRRHVIYTRDGKKLNAFRSRSKTVFEDGIASFNNGWGSGFINENGEVTLRMKKSSLSKVQYGMVIAKRGGVTRVLNTKGDTMIHADRKPFRIVSRNIVLSSSHRSQGKCLLTTNGTLLADQVVNAMPTGNPEIAKVKVGELWGLYDNDGIWKSEANYHAVGDFKNGRSWVGVSAVYAIADERGTIMLSTPFEKYQVLGDGYFMLINGNKTGYLNASGRWIWKMEE